MWCTKIRPLPLLGLVLLAVASACAPGASSGEAPLISVPDNGSLRALVYDGSGGGLLKAAPGGVYRSGDAAKSWVPLPVRGPLKPSGFSSVTTSWENPKTLAASGPEVGVIASQDGGQSWKAVDSGLPNQRVPAVALHVNRPQTLYAWPEGKGIYKTENLGGTWQRMDDGPPVSKINALAHSTLPGSMNTGWLYAASPEGLYLSMDCF